MSMVEVTGAFLTCRTEEYFLCRTTMMAISVEMILLFSANVENASNAANE